MLKLVDIKKDYKVADSYVHALKGIDLQFRESEFVCILGQSGCGKTTLLNIIGGLDHYTSGDLVIDGKSTKDFKDRDWDVYRNHRIGFIFQSYNLIPHQTVLGNVEIALTIAGISREERKARATQALERVGLGNELNKRPNQLSGGQCQRVAIARALVNNPDILLADEPTGALDSETSVQIMELIKEIAGERLVIMVTHNPDLAEQYATRIVRFKDGLVEADSNPFEGEAGEVSKAEAQAPAVSEKKGKKEKKARTRMGWLTTLALSARNLLTKKGRTILTSVGGSIGIISVCLVLALSNGFNHYIKQTEEEMLSYYPVEITETAFDMTSLFTSFTSAKDMPDMDQLGDKVYVDSFLTNLGKKIAVKNDISSTYIEYVEEMNPSWYSAIQYTYGVGLTDNLFTTVDTGINEDVIVTKNMSLSALKEFYIGELMTYAAEQYGSLVRFADFFGNIINKMPGSSDLSDPNYGKYVLSQYDVLEGQFPQNANEAVLVIGDNNQVTDLTLAQLGMLPEPQFLSLFDIGKESEEDDADGEEKYLTIDFKDILDKNYVFYFNDEVYTPATGEYPFEYAGERDNLDVNEKTGIQLDVVGILRLKEGLTYGCLNPGLNLTEKLVEDYIAANIKSDIVKYMKANSVSANGNTIYLSAPAKGLEGYYSQKLDIPVTNPDTGEPMTTMMVAIDNSALRHVGGLDTPNGIKIYATDFDGKDHLLSYLDEWNTICETPGGSYHDVELTQANKITYTDTVGMLMGMMQTMLNAITYVLVAFTAISLVVSSVMIGIITYVSVVERIKEIGVLRSLGARKRDIKNLFNAETFIIGLSAGLLGVIVTYLLSFALNAVLATFTGIAGLASLSPVAALVMILVSVGLTLISGLIPASAAAKKDPVIALRTE